MKMYFALARNRQGSWRAAIELTLFPGGYAGMQPVENGRTVLCIAVRNARLPAYGGSWPGLIAAIEPAQPAFRRDAGRRPTLLPRPAGGRRHSLWLPGPAAPREALFRLGDQAAVIPR